MFPWADTRAGDFLGKSITMTTASEGHFFLPASRVEIGTALRKEGEEGGRNESR